MQDVTVWSVIKPQKKITKNKARKQTKQLLWKRVLNHSKQIKIPPICQTTQAPLHTVQAHAYQHHKTIKGMEHCGRPP